MEKLFKKLWALETFLLGSGLAAVALLPTAYDSRGYWAVGGEWILILLAGFVSQFVLEDLF